VSPNDLATTRIRPAREPVEPVPDDEGTGQARHRLAWVLACVGGLLVVGLLVTLGARLASGRSEAPAPRPSPAPTQTPTPGREEAVTGSIERAVARHWRLIVAGRYAEAYDAFAPGLKARVPRSGWIQAQAQDRLASVRVAPRAQLDPSGLTAHAEVTSMRTVANSGCFTWTGSYELERVDGTWRISGSRLTRSPC
jgi:hypothetical protein